MASIVNISPVSNEITLDKKGEGVFVFAVTSTMDASIRVGAKILVENPEEQQWVRIEGDQERALKAGETDQFTVSVRAPESTEPGNHGIRLLIYAVDQPGEEYTEGPQVSFEIPVRPGDSNIPEKKKPFPVWIVVVGVVVLLAIIGGIVTWIILGSNHDQTKPEPAPEPEPTVEMITVPDISGLTEEAATTALSGAGLTVAEVREQPAADKPLGTVIEQIPTAGEEVDASTGITITLAAVDTDHKAKVCTQFAQEGLRQHQQNLDNSCGLSGAGWSSDFGYHYTKCDNATDYQALSSRLNDERQTQLDACLRAKKDKNGFCAQYAKTAVQQQNKNKAGGCDFAGARWSTNLKAHADWCLAQGDNYRSRSTSEEKARADSLTRCNQEKRRKIAHCQTYAKTAVQQQYKNKAEGCGFTGARWSTNLKAHADWCLAQGDNYRSRSTSEEKARTDSLFRCGQTNKKRRESCEAYAKTAIKQQAENLAHKCGFLGNRWQSDYDNHYNWCIQGNNYKDHAPKETQARKDDLKRCSSRPKPMEHNTDRPGSDYKAFDLSKADPALCQRSCEKEGKCRAWTYVKPGIQKLNARCWLKSRIPAAKSSSCCVSGVK